MSELSRRSFLATAWKWGLGLLTAAGVWTSWDLLAPRLAAGVGAIVRTVPPTAVPVTGVLVVPEARGYLANIDGEIVAFAEACSHLSCRVPFIEEADRFECPCHGSVFSRDGDYISGPAPRGMDQYGVQVVDGVVEIDTSLVIDGPPAGSGG